MNALQTTAPLTVRARPLAHKSWWIHLLWVLAAASVGFGVPAVFVGLFRLPRNIYLIPYVLLVGTLLWGYVRWSNLNAAGTLRHNWLWGLAGAVVASVFASRTVLMQPASPAPRGMEMVFDLLWLGLAYGTVDALFLSALPLSATWQAFAELGWTKRWPGRIAAGALALAASLLVIAVYHLGYPEFRGPQVLVVVLGVGIQSLLTLLTGNPIVAVLGHIAMHMTAVFYGLNTVSQLPPHY